MLNSVNLLLDPKFLDQRSKELSRYIGITKKTKIIAIVLDIAGWGLLTAGSLGFLIFSFKKSQYFHGPLFHVFNLDLVEKYGNEIWIVKKVPRVFHDIFGQSYLTQDILKDHLATPDELAKIKIQQAYNLKVKFWVVMIFFMLCVFSIIFVISINTILSTLDLKIDHSFKIDLALERNVVNILRKLEETQSLVDFSKSFERTINFPEGLSKASHRETCGYFNQFVQPAIVAFFKKPTLRERNLQEFLLEMIKEFNRKEDSKELKVDINVLSEIIKAISIKDEQRKAMFMIPRDSVNLVDWVFHANFSEDCISIAMTPCLNKTITNAKEFEPLRSHSEKNWVMPNSRLFVPLSVRLVQWFEEKLSNA